MAAVTIKKKYLYTVIVLIVISITVGSIFFFDRNITSSYTYSSSELGEEISILGRNHVPEGTRVTYNSNPPTSGDHWPQPADWGFYLSPLPDEQLVHNLEHGGIWISYKDIDTETKSKLGSIASKYPQAVIITPRQENDAKITVASWGRLLKLNEFNEEIITKFIINNVNKAPEPLASLEKPAVLVGVTFPDFRVTEVDGRVITRDSLKGKPTIIWFTTSWCVPCQIGAKKVAALDNELGGDAFNVLVIFVDPRETNSDLINWREKFANSDWMVAFDNFASESDSLSARIGLRFLDTKFLLDKNSIIKNIDFQIADEDYLNKIRQVVDGSK